MPVLTLGDGTQLLDLVDIAAPAIAEDTGVGVERTLVVATKDAFEAGLEALNEAILGDGESVAA
jgi:hypothetical protein